MKHNNKKDLYIKMFGYYEPRIEQLVPEVERKWEYQLAAKVFTSFEFGIVPVIEENHTNPQSKNSKQTQLF